MKPSTSKLSRNSFFLTVTASVLLSLLAAVPGVASTITVTSLADDGSPGTLRYAIASASPGDAIIFALNLSGTITLTQGVLEINKNLTISGPGPKVISINGNNASQVFLIDPAVTVAISQVAIVQGVGGPNTSPPNSGGGVFNYGTLSLDNVLVSGNSASNVGGGLYNGFGSMTVSNSVFSNNSGGDGAGIYNNGGTLTVSNSTLSGNSATDVGGGLSNYSGTTTISGSTFSGNSSSFGGGGIGGANGGGTINVTNSTLSGNTAHTGGGIWEPLQSIFVVNATIAGNTASTGGGVAGPGGHLTLKNTIVAGNSGGNCSNGVNSGGHNLSDDSSCTSFFTGVGDINNTPAQLDPGGLKSNGGTTSTIALLFTSPAVNAVPFVPTNYCTAIDGMTPIPTDQRGDIRPYDFACDIGAFELQQDTDQGLALLNGSNTFTGNQTISGAVIAASVSAASFAGNGSGVTNLNPANLSPGTANINITGTAATAATAGTAADATALGGVLANNYARLDIANAFTGNQTVAGNITASGTLTGASANLTGALTGTSATLAGLLSTGGVFLPSTGTATASQAFSSNTLDTAASVFNSSAGAAQNQLFRWQAEPAANSNNTATPSATLNLLFGSSGTPAETGLSLNANGTINFSPGQTFPGGGTITGVTAGNGLTGGGSTGNVTLSNTGILSMIAGSGLSSTGGQTPTLSLNTTFTDSRYLALSGGTMTGNLTAPSFSGSGSALTNLNPASLSAGTAAINISGTAATAFTATSASSAANAANLGGVPAGSYARLDIGNAFTGNQGVTGDVSVSGNLATTGTLAIGSGSTPIKEHLSMTFNPNFPPLKPSTCLTTTFNFTGASDGDTTALGVPSARMIGGGTLIYTAFVLTPNTITIQACNINPNAPQKTAGSGAIRVDIWKH